MSKNNSSNKQNNSSNKQKKVQITKKVIFK